MQLTIFRGAMTKDSFTPRSTLSALALAVDAHVAGDDVTVSGIALDSRLVQPGQLFVAIPGATVDGMRFVTDALRAGAVAVCATRPVDGIPTLVTAEPRRAAALLSAELFRYPARELHLLGITGSLGKTSTALLAEAALGGAGIRTGVIGSLGIRFRGRVVQTGMTTPEAPAIHDALRKMVGRQVGAAVMEVTSHSILLDRVAGLQLAAGCITNIVADEHLEFHPSPEHYVQTKARFVDMLEPGAPLIVNVDNATARKITRGLDRPVIDVTANARVDAHVSITNAHMSASGSRFTLRVERPITALHGGLIDPAAIDITLPLLGERQIGNAALAATLALVAGGSPEGVASGLARVAPIRRRTQVIQRDGPIVIDDTVGNAESVRSVFETARQVGYRRLFVAYAIRGSRGTTVNERNAKALGAEVSRSKARLVVTASEDSAGPRDRVTQEEQDIVLTTLEREGVTFEFVPTLKEAIERVLAEPGREDMVLLLGAQGMDRGAELAGHTVV